VLLDQLAEELRAMGLKTRSAISHGYVMATVPATTKKANVPVIGFGRTSTPRRRRAARASNRSSTATGRAGHRAAPMTPTAVLRVSEIPILREQIGNDIITASGTTLLGPTTRPAWRRSWRRPST